MDYDIFMLVFGEPNAEENWARLQTVAARARRIQGIPGILESYRLCCQAATTPYFFVVDADNWMLDGFDFDVPFEPREDEIATWAATNPINGLYYGHGGIKLFPVSLFAKPPRHAFGLDYPVDLAARKRWTDIRASEHRFNTDPYATWSAAFRECVKLAVGFMLGDGKSRRKQRYRLDVWCRTGEKAPYGPWCLRGAREGRAYGLNFFNDREKLLLINDYDWMRRQFRAQHVRKIAIPLKAKTEA
jgi:hypothetical protein